VSNTVVGGFGKLVGTITFGPNFKFTEKNTFRGQSRITSVYINEGFTSLGEAAFYECSTLNEILLPSTMVSYYYSSFSNTAIKTVYIYNSDAMYNVVHGSSGHEDQLLFFLTPISGENGGNTSRTGCKIFVQPNLLTAYKTNEL
jgi:hypothetical protein